MPRRPYTPVERQRAVDAGRARILEAARDLLRLDDLAAFSLDAVARRAGVTRMTVYNQFGSKAGLLEALFDLLVERGAFAEMPAVFMEKDAEAALDAFVAIFGRFYTDNRAVLGSLAAAAGADPDLAQAVRARNALRRRAIEGLLARIGTAAHPAIPKRELAHTLDVLLGFPTFDAIAGRDRTPNDVVPLMRQMIRALLAIEPAARPATARRGAKAAPRRKRS